MFSCLILRMNELELENDGARLFSQHPRYYDALLGLANMWERMEERRRGFRATTTTSIVPASYCHPSAFFLDLSERAFGSASPSGDKHNGTIFSKKTSVLHSNYGSLYKDKGRTECSPYIYTARKLECKFRKTAVLHSNFLEPYITKKPYTPWFMAYCEKIAIPSTIGSLKFWHFHFSTALYSILSLTFL